jgi:glycosyltransferase involved in cell wall biosynthesis
LPPGGEYLRATLVALLGDRAALERMSAYSLQLVAERYSWPAHTDALLHAYAATGWTRGGRV